jgi:hypothetical protein
MQSGASLCQDHPPPGGTCGVDRRVAIFEEPGAWILADASPPLRWQRAGRSRATRLLRGGHAAEAGVGTTAIPGCPRKRREDGIGGQSRAVRADVSVDVVDGFEAQPHPIRVDALERSVIPCLGVVQPALSVVGRLPALPHLPEGGRRRVVRGWQCDLGEQVGGAEDVDAALGAAGGLARRRRRMVAVAQRDRAVRGSYGEAHPSAAVARPVTATSPTSASLA